ncbi:hypothetical protein [Francisella tularensis]|nr:hypothetical protein [Francisella tularensis]
MFIIVISTFIIWIDDIVKLGQVRTSLARSENMLMRILKSM